MIDHTCVLDVMDGWASEQTEARGHGTRARRHGPLQPGLLTCCPETWGVLVSHLALFPSPRLQRVDDVGFLHPGPLPMPMHLAIHVPVLTLAPFAGGQSIFLRRRNRQAVEIAWCKIHGIATLMT